MIKAKDLLEKINKIKQIKEGNIFRDFTYISDLGLDYFKDKDIVFQDEVKASNNRILTVLVTFKQNWGFRIHKVYNHKTVNSSARPVQSKSLAIKKAKNELDDFLDTEEN